MSPLPSGRVIPTGWAGRHAPISTAGMTGTCTITREAVTPTWNPVSGPGDGATEIVYEGVCRVSADGSPGAVRDAAGQPTAPRTYTVAVPEHADAAPGDLVTIDTAPGRPGAVGRTFTVLAAAAGTDAFETLLTCTDQQ